MDNKEIERTKEQIEDLEQNIAIARKQEEQAKRSQMVWNDSLISLKLRLKELQAKSE